MYAHSSFFTVTTTNQCFFLMAVNINVMQSFGGTQANNVCKQFPIKHIVHKEKKSFQHKNVRFTHQHISIFIIKTTIEL